MSAARKRRVKTQRAGDPKGSRSERLRRNQPRSAPKKQTQKKKKQKKNSTRSEEDRGMVSGMFRRRSLVPADKVGNSRRPESASIPPSVPMKVRYTLYRERLAAWWLRARRGVMLVLRLVMLALLLAATLAIGRLVERHVRTSPAFATQEVTLEGNERLEREAVLAAASLAEGQNVFEIGPEDAQALLAGHPWIASAEVTRRLPGSFDVVVREHHAVAVISLSKTDDDPAGLYLVAEDGTVFKRVGEGDPVDLPVVTGIDRGRFIRDRAFRTSVLLEVVALLHDYRGAGLWRRMPIGEIHVESNDGLSLYVGEDILHVRLGRGPFRQKLRRLRRVLDQLDEQGSQAQYVYLDNVRRPDRVTVRLRD